MRVGDVFCALYFQNSPKFPRLNVLNGFVLRDTVAYQLQGDALLTEEVVLRVGDQHRCVSIVNIHDVSPHLI